MKQHREDYEELEYDYDCDISYWKRRDDVLSPISTPDLDGLRKWFFENEPKDGLYYKGTRFYFTFNGFKYYLTFVHFDHDFLIKAFRKFKRHRCSNIQVNLGELD